MAGYSGTPLWKKLGIRADQRLVVFGGPEDYEELIAPSPEGVLSEASPSDASPTEGPSLDALLPEGVVLSSKMESEASFIHLFVQQRKALEQRLPACVRHLSKQGALWISWPKKAAKVKTDLDGNVVRRTGLEAGLVDVKVCAIDATWSGLKFVFRLVDR